MKKLVHLQFLFLVKIFATQFLTPSSSSFAASNPSIAPVYTTMTTFSPGIFFFLFHFFGYISIINIDCSLNEDYLGVCVLVITIWLTSLSLTLFNFWVSGFYLRSSNFENQNENCFCIR